MFTLFLNRSLLELAQRRRAALFAGAGFEVATNTDADVHLRVCVSWRKRHPPTAVRPTSRWSCCGRPAGKPAGIRHCAPHILTLFDVRSGNHPAGPLASMRPSVSC